MNKKQYQKYINNFRRNFTQLLKPGIGLSCHIYPSKDGGGILEFTMGDSVENDDIYKEESGSLGEALGNVKQNAFAGNIDGITFGGTNTILEPHRIIYIKDSNKKEWNEQAAHKDVQQLLTNAQRGQK